MRMNPFEDPLWFALNNNELRMQVVKTKDILGKKNNELTRKKCYNMLYVILYFILSNKVDTVG